MPEHGGPLMVRPLRVAAGCAAAAVLAASGGLAVSTARLSSDIATVSLHSQVPASVNVPTGSGFDPVGVPVNLLLLGSDARTGTGNSAYGNPKTFDTARADTTMLVHIAADRSWVSVLSIPRDLVTTVALSSPACGSGRDRVTRINEAFTAGGPACTVAAVEKLTGVPVNHVAAIDFNGFVTGINRLGGLKVCLRQPVVDAQAAVKLPAGVQTVDGKSALGLMRARKTLADGSDLTRTDRQQYLLRLLVAQVKKRMVSDPMAAWKTVNDLAGSLTTDEKLADSKVLLDAAGQLAGIDDSRVYTRTLPTKPDPDAPLSTVVVRNPQANKLFADMLADRPWHQDRPGGTGTKPSQPARAPEPAATVPVDTSDVGDIFCPVV